MTMNRTRSFSSVQMHVYFWLNVKKLNLKRLLKGEKKTGASANAGIIVVGYCSLSTFRFIRFLDQVDNWIWHKEKKRKKRDKTPSRAFDFVDCQSDLKMTFILSCEKGGIVHQVSSLLSFTYYNSLVERKHWQFILTVWKNNYCCVIATVHTTAALIQLNSTRQHNQRQWILIFSTDSFGVATKWYKLYLYFFIIKQKPKKKKKDEFINIWIV